MDTIVAQATAPGFAGVGIVRISGHQARAVAQRILNKVPKVRHADYLPFLGDHGEVIDQGIALFFAKPNSFTGEDVLELQAHGGPVILDLLVQQALRVDGVRIANPGEFSQQAFINDKLDLAQAEAIADLIHASSEQAVKSAARSLQGEFSQAIQKLVNQMTHVRMYVEAAIDFPEEEIDFLSDQAIFDQLSAIEQSFVYLREQTQQGTFLQEGLTLVLAGKPNAGKSSLLNALAEKESAIVTDIAGTTRDTLKESIQINGIPLHIIDTAGLRDTVDRVEQEGVKRAKDAIAQADRILLVVDRQSQQDFAQLKQIWLEDLTTHNNITIVYNKIDLLDEQPQIVKGDDHDEIYLSAKQGLGIDLLREYLLASAGAEQSAEGSFIARRRHLDAIERAQKTFSDGLQQLQQHQAGELLAEDLRQCQHILGEITGTVTADDLLGDIFSSFCIGK